MPLGFHVVNSDPDELQIKIEEGYTFIVYGIDYLFLRDAAINGMKKIRKKQ